MQQRRGSSKKERAAARPDHVGPHERLRLRRASSLGRLEQTRGCGEDGERGGEGSFSLGSHRERVDCADSQGGIAFRLAAATTPRAAPSTPRSARASRRRDEWTVLARGRAGGVERRAVAFAPTPRRDEAAPSTAMVAAPAAALWA